MENANFTELSPLEVLKLKRKPFPLRNLLILYFNAHSRDVYIEHFRGLKLLVEWLGPIELPTEPLTRNYPSVLTNYETQWLASYFKVDWRYIVDIVWKEFENGNIRNH